MHELAQLMAQRDSAQARIDELTQKETKNRLTLQLTT